MILTVRNFFNLSDDPKAQPCQGSVGDGTWLWQSRMINCCHIDQIEVATETEETSLARASSRPGIGNGIGIENVRNLRQAHLRRPLVHYACPGMGNRAQNFEIN